MTLVDEAFRTELARGDKVCRGRYTIDHRISCGGTSAVYAARTPDGQDVALKILDARHVAKSTPAQRMENEMRIGAALFDLPSVVRPLDHGIIPELQDRPFIAFELVRGTTLDALINAKALPQRKACEIARSLADTLVQLHSRGVIHRDIKPSNIFVDEQHGLCVRLIDFGFAFSSGVGPLPNTSELTQTFEITGTVHYMAPEHCMAAPPAPSFDIYGLACTLWEMVVGYGPYLGHDPEEVLRRKRDRSCPTPSISACLSASKLDPEIAELIDLGMRRDPRERIASAEEFRRRLDAILERLGGVRGRTLPAMTTSTGAPRRRWWPHLLLACLMLGASSAAAHLLVRENEVEEVRPTHANVLPPSLPELHVGFATDLEASPSPPQASDRVDSPPPPVHAAAVEAAPPLARAPTPEASPRHAPRSSPVRATAPAVQSPSSEQRTPSPCAETRAALRGAQRKAEWGRILSLTEAHPSCWPNIDRALLRIPALRSLGRFRACVAEGEPFLQTEVQRAVSSCRARLKEP